jgi:hypothetical protein
MSKRTLAAAVAAMCVFCTNLAFADDTSTYVANQVGKDENVTFKDDILDAHGFGAGDVRIRVMPAPKRVLLLRPRTQFVTEMLKSVEAL